MSTEIHPGKIFNVDEAQGKDRVALETTAAEAQIEAPNAKVAREIEKNAEHVHDAAEFAAKAAQNKGPQITGGLTATEQLQLQAQQITNAAVLEGQRDLEAAQNAGADYVQQAKDLANSEYVQQAKDLAGSAATAAQSAAATAFETGKTYIASAQKAAEPYIENAKNSLGINGVQETQGTPASSTGIPSTSAPLESGPHTVGTPYPSTTTTAGAPKIAENA